MKDVMRALTDFDAASAADKALEPRMLALAKELEPDEVREVFRRVAAGEITAGEFVQRFAAAVAAADLENFVVLLLASYKLLVKYPRLLEQHRARPRDGREEEGERCASE